MEMAVMNAKSAAKSCADLLTHHEICIAPTYALDSIDNFNELLGLGC